MMKSRRSTRGLSPIFATLILIAIAVIAGIVVYMFASGTIASLTGGGTAGQEKAAVQGVNVATGTVYAQNTGGPEITINSAIVKDASGNIVSQAVATGTLTTDGAVVSIIVGLPAPQASAMTYTVTLTSTRGGSFVSSSFVVPAIP